VFRSGPNQYWNTVDPFSLDRLELVLGPSSVVYGSDAVGGTVNAITLSPSVPREGRTASAGLLVRASSAETSGVGRLEVLGGLGGTGAILAGFSAKRFGDLVGGKQVGVMEKTGYRETDADIKAVLDLGGDWTLTSAVQHVSIEDAWRTHKTIYGISWHGTTVGNEKKRALDQQRDLGYLQAEWKGDEGLLRRFKASISFQEQQEDRERVKSSDARDTQGFDAGTAGFWLMGEAETPAGRVILGLEAYHDTVNSFARKFDAVGTLTAVEIQGPVGDDARYDLFGAFLQDELPVGSIVSITAGLRFTWASAFAGEVQDPVTGDPIEVDGSWSNLSASLRAWLEPASKLRVFAGVTQGFRAPNLSDLTRLDEARSNEIETPSPGLDPETFIGFEVGCKADRDPLRVRASIYYTVIRDGIVRYPTGDMIGTDYEVTKANVGDGTVWGAEAEARLALAKGLEAAGGVSWTEGMQDTYTDTRVLVRDWISRLAPPAGFVSLRWTEDRGRFWCEGEVLMAGKASKLSLRDQADTQRIPPGGTPGYALLNFRVGARVTEHVSFFASAENILDKDYRVHGSGVNGPGANLVLGIEID
jgi:hemoglobin/transferrin/lactoferrin receptor protein